MSLDKKNIAHIAVLARLQIDAKETESYAGDLSRILDLVETMNSVDTGDLEPLAHPLELKARLREDVVNEPNQRDTFQSLAPEVADGHYLVPKVIE